MKGKRSIIAALAFAAVLSSCGRDVPAVETSKGNFTIAGGSSEGDENSEVMPLPDGTSAPEGGEAELPAENDPTVTKAAAEGGFTAGTRSPEELNAINASKTSGGTSNTKPTTAAGGSTVGGSTGGSSTGGSANNDVTGGGSTGGGTGTGNGNGGTGSGTGGGTGTGTGSGTGGQKPTEQKKPTGITLSYYSAELIVGQTLGYPLVSENINEIWSSSDTSIATVDSIGNITGKGVGSCVISVVSADDRSVGAEVKVTVKEAGGVQVVEGITYVQGILIANKSYGLPSTYNPGDLTADTYSAFYSLSNAAAADGLSLWVCSGFRSYDYQNTLYNNYVSWNGQAAADTFSARPGFSEHQTGLAIDVNDASDNFIGTPEAEWLAAHCEEYGFIIRYPYGKQSVTGYKYEPWHIRYVGKDVAKAFRAAANAAGDPYYTLEEYLGIDSYYH